MRASLLTPESSRTNSRNRAWLWAGIVATIGLGIAGMVLLISPANTTALDPDSPAPQGSMALANILQERGTAVHRVRKLAEATTEKRDNTLVIISNSLIGTDAAARLSGTRSERTVIVGTSGSAADSLVHEIHVQEATELAADCSLPEAAEAGRATFSDELVSGEGSRCFPGETGAGLLHEGSRFVLADGTSLMNQTLAESGNAALAINLLSTTANVTWYLPSANDVELLEGSTRGLSNLLPDWFAPVVFQLLLLFAVLAIWRGRRLGPLIREDLPIVVPAHETDQGFASLLERNGNAGHAARVLRLAAVTRLARTCGLPSHTSVPQVVEALATQLDESPLEIAEILHERPIETDTQLVELRTQLARLENEVHNQ